MPENTPLASIDEAVQKAQQAFLKYRFYSVRQRAELMRSVARAIEGLGPELIRTAQEETHLPEGRLTGEKARTVFQWDSYADALEKGLVMDIRINTADTTAAPPKPDLRKTSIGLGVVAVFGASNFPFAFSTAGTDTAAAIAAGCPAVVKAHPGHPKTAALFGRALLQAITSSGAPEGLFAQVYGDNFESGRHLAGHPLIKAVGFTGSFQGGKALYDIAVKRPEPIPVFAEMSSTNPVFLLPGILHDKGNELVQQYVASLTLGTGQFCTNPGLLIAMETNDLASFKAGLKDAIEHCGTGVMLHPGIARNYESNLARVSRQPAVNVFTRSAPGDPNAAQAVMATVSAPEFIKNPILAEEVFGPFGMVVLCKDSTEMTAVAEALHGQLTATMLANPRDIAGHKQLMDILAGKCGRLLLNQFPTGVEVSLSQQHGGPYPATTDSRFTSVGPDAIKRFLRPISYQNWPDEALPDELKNGNPLRIWRTVNNEISREAI